MITVSEEQLEEIESIRWSDFVDQLVVSTRQCFPPHVEMLTDAELFDAISGAGVRADELGFKYDDEIEEFVDHAIVFGAQFDTDPCMVWAGELLRDSAFALPSEKLDFLDNKIRRYALDVFDDDSVSIPVEAFRRFETLLEDQFSDDNASNETERLLKKIWPEKVAACESAYLAAFLRSSIELARIYGFDEPWAQARFALIGFMLGHRFDIDPFYSRLTDVLNVAGPEPHLRLFNVEQVVLSDVVRPRLRWAQKNNGA